MGLVTKSDVTLIGVRAWEGEDRARMIALIQRWKKNGSQVVVFGSRAGPNPVATPTSLATLSPTLTGVAVPDSNPQAPQVPVTVLASTISLIAPDTVKAGTTGRLVSVTLLDSNGTPALGARVRFNVSHGAAPASVLSDFNGVAQVNWFAQDSTGKYTLTGFRDVPGGTVPTDSAGLIVIRRSVVVIAGPPDAVKSTVSVLSTTVAANGTTTVSVVVKDAFNNPVLSAAPGDITLAATAGTLNAGTCAAGVCSYTYTAPAAAGPATVTVKIGGINVTNSPLALTITP